MSQRLQGVLGGVAGKAGVVVAAAALTLGASGAPVAAGTDPPPPVTANELIPDRDLGDCISALPKPDCGSEGRGDWHQGLVFAALAGGLVFIGWRVVHGVRRRSSPPAPVEQRHEV